ncbi:MAG: carboxypeptidase regulatory-like domain-containing protein [Gemmatimonadota bacterium]|nr:carboxypeptidase regulatory-like domain-containing protein [Gemmatimonadota bacterium]
MRRRGSDASSFLRAGVLILPFLSAPALLSGQVSEGGQEVEPLGRIIARLVDAQTGAPVTEAFVELTSMQRRALSDSTGTAVFLDLPPGGHQLRIRRIGYDEKVVDLAVEGMQTAIVAVPMAPEAVAVAPLDVLIEYRPRYLEEKGFYARRAVGMGQFFDPQFVERWGVGGWVRADRFIDLLLDMSPPISPSATCTASGPAVYVDGQPVFDDDGRLGGRPSTELEMMSTYMIGAVEVYPGSHGVPDLALEPEFGCGSIVIWTNRWRGRTRELGGGDVELCQPGGSELPAATVEGTIRDEHTGVLLPGAHVLATTWPEGRPRAAETREIVSDRQARYRVCDVPLGNELTLQVATADRTSPELAVPVDEPIVQRDLEIRVAGPGDLVGRVVDRETGEPVASADITVHGEGSRAQTDARGYFRLEEVLPGDHVVEIAHLGFEPVTEVVSVVADRTVDLRVELSADPIELEPLVVTALRDRRLELRGYYERRRWGERSGLGTFFDAAEIERRVPAATTSLLREVPGVRVRCSGSRDCFPESSRTTGCRRMNVYLNGTLALGVERLDPTSIDELVRPSEIAGLEVYAGGASVPAEYSGTTGRCGAVVIWTK